MEEKTKIEHLFTSIKLYTETRYDLLVLNTQDKVSEILASMASVLFLAVFGFLILLFLSLGAAWYIGELTGEPSMGFFILGGFYALVMMLCYIMKEKWIRLPIINAIIKKITIREQH